LRLTLSDGTVTHDDSFQPIDEHRTEMTLADGRRELLFVDSYKYNIAEAERLKRKIAPPTMMPGTSRCTRSGFWTSWFMTPIPISPMSLSALTGKFVV
jgi:hypothetical protein